VSNITIPTSNFKKAFYQYLIALTALLALSITIEKGEDVLLINGFNTRFLDNFFSIITNLGDGMVFLPIVIVLLFISFRYAIMSLLVCVLSGLTSSFFKQVLFPELQRPKNIIDNSLLHFVEGVKVHGSHSFPSGHTMTAFCAALFITFVSKNKTLGLICLTFALLVGYSRIYLLQHFLMDVTAGAIIGCLCTCIVWYFFEINNTPEWMNRKINLNFKAGENKQLDRAS
jgi:membrane-associated phospholipid phosphatase